MYQLHIASLELGWTVYGPALAMVVLIILGVPIWVVLGLGTVLLLSLTDVMPLTLIGETLFSGIDSFSLIAVPLFILTGDVIVTTGSQRNCSVWRKPHWVGSAPAWEHLRSSVAVFSLVSRAPMRLMRRRSGGLQCPIL